MTIDIRAAELGPNAWTSFGIAEGTAVYTNGAWYYYMDYLTGTSSMTSTAVEMEVENDQGVVIGSVWDWWYRIDFTITGYASYSGSAVLASATIGSFHFERSDSGTSPYEPDFSPDHGLAVNIAALLAGQAYDYVGSTGDDTFDVTVLGGGVARMGRGDDWVHGGDGDDKIWGDAGNDHLYGGDGNDIIFGGAGDDIIEKQGTGSANFHGGAGNDTVSGDDGVDYLYGDDGDDILNGWGGNDTLIGGAGADSLYGGAGQDFISYATAKAGLTVSLADSGINTGDAAGDTYGDVENVRGSSFDDFIYGDAGNNVLRGGAGSDHLFGGDGQDRLYGESGNDFLTGGAMHDKFYFAGNFGHDTITDYDQGPGTDQVRLIGFGSDFDTFDEVAAVMRQEGSSVVVEFDEDRSITFLDLNINQLNATDFIFY